MFNFRYTKLNRIIASYLAVCMLAMAAFPYGNISYATTQEIPVAEEPTTQEPTTTESSTEKSEPEESGVQESENEEPTSEEPVTEKIEAEEAVSEEPTPEKSAQEGSISEESTSEDPVPGENELTQEESELGETSAKDPDVNVSVTEEPVTEDPVTEDPVIEDPVTEDPVIEDPVIEDPVTEDPVIEDPVIEDPITEDPVIEDPVTEDPVTEDPVTEDPVTEDPVIEDPVIEDPVIEDPVTEDPVTEDPVIEDPVIEDPVIEESVIKAPLVKQPVAEGLIVKEQATQQSVNQTPTNEQIVVQETQVEEVVIEDQEIEEPLVEDVGFFTMKRSSASDVSLTIVDPIYNSNYAKLGNTLKLSFNDTSLKKPFVKFFSEDAKAIEAQGGTPWIVQKNITETDDYAGFECYVYDTDENGELVYKYSLQSIICIDNTKPYNLTIGTVDYGAVESNIATANITVNDNYDIYKIQVSTDGGNTWLTDKEKVFANSEGYYTASFDFTFDAMGEYTFRAIDYAGNISEILETSTVKITEGKSKMEIITYPKQTFARGEIFTYDDGEYQIKHTFGEPEVYNTGYAKCDMADANITQEVKSGIVVTLTHPLDNLLTDNYTIDVILSGDYTLEFTESSEASESIVTTVTTSLSNPKYAWSTNPTDIGTQVYRPLFVTDSNGITADEQRIFSFSTSGTDVWTAEGNVYNAPFLYSNDGSTIYANATIVINTGDKKGNISFDWKTASNLEHYFNVTINDEDAITNASGFSPKWNSFSKEYSSDDGKFVIELSYEVGGFGRPTSLEPVIIQNLTFEGAKKWKTLTGSIGDDGLFTGTAELAPVLGRQNYLFIKGNISETEEIEPVVSPYIYKGIVNLQGIEINTVPTKTLYKVGDKLNIAGGYITLINDVGFEKVSMSDGELAINGSTRYTDDNGDKILDDVVFNEVGVTEIEVTYEGKSACFDVLVIDDSGVSGNANKPKIATGMIPVKWYEKGRYWITTTTDDADWYNYTSTDDEDKKWANVMLRDDIVIQEVDDVSNVKSLSLLAGKKVLSEGSSFVWIPRYSYKVGDEKISIIWSDETDDTDDTSFIPHPAFSYDVMENGSLVTKELTGFWMAKYEASLGDSVKVASKPGMVPYYKETEAVTLLEAYNLSRGMMDEVNSANKNKYGIDFSNAISHLTKQAEWGAVALLSYSDYGNVPYINNSVISQTTVMTGYSGATMSESDYTLGTSSGDAYYMYDVVSNGANTMAASTTGNAYGIFDMSGGTEEYVAAYVKHEDMDSKIDYYGDWYPGTYEVGDIDIIDISDSDAASESDFDYLYDILKEKKGWAIFDIYDFDDEVEYWNCDEDLYWWDDDAIYGEFEVDDFDDRDAFFRGGTSRGGSDSGILATSMYLANGNGFYGFRPTILVIGNQSSAEVEIEDITSWIEDSEGNKKVGKFASPGDSIVLQVTADGDITIEDFKFIEEGSEDKTMEVTTINGSYVWTFKYKVKGEIKNSETGVVERAADKGELKYEFTFNGAEESGSTGMIMDTTGNTPSIDKISGTDGVTIVVKPGTQGDDESSVDSVIVIGPDGEIIKDKDGNEIGNLGASGGSVTVDKEGNYTVIVTDKAGNTTETDFTISSGTGDGELNTEKPQVKKVSIYVTTKLDGDAEEKEYSITELKAANRYYILKGDKVRLEMEFDKDLDVAPWLTVLKESIFTDSVQSNTNPMIWNKEFTASSEIAYTDFVFDITKLVYGKATNEAVISQDTFGYKIPYDGTNVDVDISTATVRQYINDKWEDIKYNETGIIKGYPIELTYIVTFSDKPAGPGSISDDYLDDTYVVSGIDGTDGINFVPSDITVYNNVGVENISILPGDSSNQRKVVFTNVEGTGKFTFGIRGATYYNEPIVNPIARDIFGHPNNQKDTDENSSIWLTPDPSLINEFTITYDADGGENAPASQVKVRNIDINLAIDEPTKIGHTFSHWEGVNMDGETVTYKPGDLYTEDADILLTAIYIPNEYTLTVNPGEHKYTQAYGSTKLVSASSETFTITYNYNGNGQDNSTALAGTLLSKWTLEGFGSISSETTDPTLYTYGLGDGTLTASYIGMSVILPSPTWDGYRLLGWYTEEVGGELVGEAGQSYTPTEDVTLYAHWELNQYKLTVNPGASVYIQAYNTTLDLTAPEYMYELTYEYRDVFGPDVDIETTIIEEVKKEFTNWTLEGYGSVSDLTASAITYTYGIGDGILTANYTGGSVILPNPTKTGYVLAGWYNAPTGGIKIGDGGDVYEPTQNMTLYARWRTDSYTVKYDSNDGQYAPESQVKNIGVDLKLTTELPIKKGHTFIHWNTSKNGDGGVFQPGANYTVDGNITLYAIWEVNQYELTVNPGGTKYVRDFGTVMSIEAPSKESYFVTYDYNGNGDDENTVEATNPFVKWELDGDGTLSDESDDPVDFTFGATDSTLTATYETTPVILPSPTMLGYTLKGWYTRATGGEKVGDGGDAYSPSETQTIYAQWQINQYTLTVMPTGDTYTRNFESSISIDVPDWSYTVTYNHNGSGESDTQDVSNGIFNGWSLEEPGSISSSTADPVIFTYGAGDSTLTASYTMEAITLPTPTRSGYSFTGWYTAATDGTKVGNGGDSYTPEGDITLYAQWKLKIYTISYNANGGTGAPESQTKRHGDTLILREDIPTYDGFVFLGWASDSSAATPSYEPGGEFTSNSNTTLFAVWGVTITATSGENGTIDPIGTAVYGRGSSVTYIMIPDDTYRVKSVKVDGISVGAVSSYMFTNLAASHTIEVIFEENTDVTIVSQAGEGGSITPEGPTNVALGTNQAYSIVADTGYRIYKIIVDGESVNFGGSSSAVTTYTYTFTNVVRKHTIRAIFALTNYSSTTHKLTVNPNGGKYNNTTSNTVHSGSYGSTVELINPVHTNAYTVTFNENEGDCSVPYLTTKDFDYWTKSEEIGTIVYNDDTKATYTFGTSDVTITASYKNDEIVLPTATRLAYTLNGWYTAATGGTKAGNAGDTYTATASITLYAQWLSNTALTLTYNSNDDAATTRSVSMFSGEKLPANTFVRAGYAFVGWNTSANGTGTSYLDRDIYSGASGVTLYAQWSLADEYLVTVESDTGLSTSGNQRVGERVILKAVEILEDGSKKQISWSSTDVTLDCTEGPETSFIMPANNVTVYQTSTEVVEDYEKYTLVTSTDGYTETITKVYAGERISLTATPRAGESIIAWEASGVVLDEYYGNETSFVMPSNDVTVRAIPGKYILTTQILDQYTSENRVAGEEITLVAASAVGQSFVGWEAIGLNVLDPMNTTLTFNMPHNNVTITAKYETYTVTTELAGMTMSGAQTAGETVTITANKIDGLTFNGWVITGATNVQREDAYSETVTFTMPYSNVTLVGEYVTYTLTSQVNTSGETVENITTGTEVTLTAEVGDGETFIRWEAVGVELDNPKAQTITFDMPRCNAEVRAIIGQYLLTVDCGDLQMSSLQAAEDEITITAPAMEGLTFVEWTATGITLADTTNPVATFIMPYTSVTLVGTYTAYTLTSQVNTDGPTVTNVTADTQVTLTATEKPGETFLRWEVDGITIADVNSPEISFVMPRANVSAIAVFGQYVLRVECDGMYFEGLQKANTEVTMTANEIDGKVFTGWTATGLTGVDTSLIELTFMMPYNDVTLIPEYIAAQAVTVEFNSNGGSEVSSQSVTYMRTYGDLPTPSKEGYTFVGWYGEEALVNQVFSTTKVTTELTHTLYAKWEINTYTITATAGAGGNIAPLGSTQVAHGDSQVYTITPDSGYGVATIVIDGVVDSSKSKTYTFTNVTEAHTIEVTFEQVYELTTNMADVLTTIILKPEGNDVIISTEDETSEKVFTGWTATGLPNSVDTTATELTFAMPNNDITLAPEYIAAQEVTVEFNSNGGSEVSSQSVMYMSFYGELPTPTKNGYMFDGWYAEEGLINKVVSTTRVTTELTHTLYAKWEINTYTITATAGVGGSITPSGSIQVNQGDNQAYTITANDGYTIDTVTIDGVDEPSKPRNYTFTNVTAGHTIEVTFREADNYDLTTNISDVLKAVISKQEDSEVTISTGEETNFTGWTITGLEAQDERSFTFDMPSNPVDVTYNYPEPDYST